MKKILITGGAGFIGSNLAQLLLQKGYAVDVIDNLITGTKNNIDEIRHGHLNFINEDVLSSQYLNKTKEQYEIVYHLASPASPKQYVKYPIETLMVNSLGTKNVLDYVIKSKSLSFVFASTSEIYGDPLVHPQIEEYWGNVSPNGERSCYDEAKRFGEALCSSYIRKYGCDIRVARIFNTYGPHMEKDDGRVISNFVVQALQNKDISIHGDGKQTRSFCFVEDMCKALYLLGTRPQAKNKTINLGNTDEKTIEEIAQLVASLTHSSSQIVFKELPPDDPKRRKPNISRAKEILGWESEIDIRQGLLLTIEYFKKRFSL
ncbi:NAD-dependent dehydratase [Candidatus Roizmanbacteria bacterium RIFCSPLOWO2_01_FULL_38_11]|uniref:NAD-dependent dehydratase n=1 Tax=Candidatus Roizmanbacteria bacterium RIFCSPLOWO2_01_FULL_38_11 TaxID=1802060 RepID=A0A1F7INV0_9BACT|nr:MAG: NAD-dependent dehydratase [Candidatus Roizmanbacteria bacterium RIFCSPLOWO2_01_FULL_38_11]